MMQNTLLFYILYLFIFTNHNSIGISCMCTPNNLTWEMKILHLKTNHFTNHLIQNTYLVSTLCVHFIGSIDHVH